MLLSALVVDEEGLAGAFKRVRGPSFQLDVSRFLSCVEDLEPGHRLLWVKWVVLDKSHLTADGSEPREPYFRHLEGQGIRVERVKPKPIHRANGTHEPNCCDFAVAESIRLAAKRADVVILAGGDGHFSSSLDIAHREFGCRAEVISDRRGLSSKMTVDRVHLLEQVLTKWDLEYKCRERCASRSNRER